MTSFELHRESKIEKDKKDIPDEGREQRYVGKVSEVLTKETGSSQEQEEMTRSPEYAKETVEKKIERINALRMRLDQKDRVPVAIDATDKTRVEETAKDFGQHLLQCHKKGFGIFPSGNPKDSFYDTLWSRDLAHAGGNFFSRNAVDATIESLNTVFSHQREDGSLPYRVERKRFLLEHLAHSFGINVTLNRKEERPVYEGQDGGNAEDTIPAIVASLGELFLS